MTAPSNFLKIGSDGNPAEEAPIQVSAGVASAGKHIAANAAGLVDSTFLPTETIMTLPTSETVNAGAQINVYSNAGVFTMRNADNTNGRPAHGFIAAQVSSGNNGTAFLFKGQNSALSGLTVGAVYFLGTAGAVITSANIPAAGSGYLLQSVGIAQSATTLVQDIKDPITRSA